jgi:hypothetical protein
VSQKPLEYYSSKQKFIPATRRVFTVVSKLVFLPACVLHVTLTIQRDKIHITYRRRRYRGAENILQSKSEGEEDMKDINEKLDDSAMHILNDLARGQNNIERGQLQIVELLTQLVNNTQGNLNNAGNNGSGRVSGSHCNNGNHVEGSNNHVPTQSDMGFTSRVTPRPHIPQFLEGQQIGNQGQQGQGEDFTDYLRECALLLFNLCQALTNHMESKPLSK